MPMEAALDRRTQPLTDEELVARVRAGEGPLFEVLMRRNNRRLYRAVRAILRDDADSEDVMQQAYVQAFAHLDQFAGEARFSTWLLRIGVNEALGRLRQRRLHLEPLDDDRDDAEANAVENSRPTPEDGAARRELAALLEQTIDALPGPYREVLVLRLVEGLGTAETAQILGLGEDAVKQRLHRGRAMVQREIEARVGTAAASLFEFHAARCDRVVTAVMARLGAG